MRCVPLEYVTRSLSIALVAAIMTLAGCQWMSPSKSGDPDGIMTADEASKLKKTNSRLKEEIESSKLDLARKNADIKNRDQLVKLLEGEVASLKSDLEYVEKQFVSFERRLTRKETKASAVSAVADVRILIDKMRAEPGAEVDAETLVEVEEKLATASQLTEKRNYSAAVYYASRAMRILNRTEHRVSAREISRNSLVVSVSRANLRSGPGPKHAVVSKLDYGTAVLQLAAKDDWLKVRTMSGQLGWIHKSLLR